MHEACHMLPQAGRRTRPTPGNGISAFQAARHERAALVAVQVALGGVLVASAHAVLLRAGVVGGPVARLLALRALGTVALQALAHELLVLVAAQALGLVGARGELRLLRA